MHAPPLSDLDSLEPDLALCAGSIDGYVAQVYPDLLFVEYSCSKSELTARGNAGRLISDALSRAADPEAVSGTIFNEVPQWAKDFAAVEAHEREHVRRIASTTHGILTHALRSQLLSKTRDLVVKQYSERKALNYPLLSEASVEDRFAINSTRTLQQALETYVPTDSLEHAERLIAGWTELNCDFFHEELPNKSNRSSLLVDDDGTQSWFTTMHLLECLGLIEEGNRVLGTGGSVDQVTQKLRNPLYSLAARIWFSHCPGSSASKNFRPIRSPSRNEIALSMSRNFPIDFLIAADLALWLPFSPRGFSSPRGELTWLDINPPYRFARIALACKKLGFAEVIWPETDLDEFVVARQEAICAHLSWETPTELARKWHEHLASKSNEWFIDGAIGGFRYKTMMQLLRLRLDHPGKVLLNGIDFQKMGVKRNAGWITNESKNELLPMYLGDEEDRESTQFLFDLYCLFPMLLGTKKERKNFVSRFPVEEIDRMLDSFNLYGEGKDGWPTNEFLMSARNYVNRVRNQ